jgi:hypothetical protein
MDISSNFVKQSAFHLATQLKGKKHRLMPHLILLGETAALRIRKAAYPDMHPVQMNGRLQEIRPIQLPEGFDPDSVEADPDDLALLTDFATQLEQEGIE